MIDGGPGPVTLGLVALGAGLVSLGLTKALRPLFVRYALARPNARSSHRAPTPQGGGIPVLLGAAVGGLAAVAAWGGLRGVAGLVAPAAALGVLALLGLADDLRPLRAWPRLLVQGGCVATLVWFVDPPPLLPVLPPSAERLVLVLAGLWWVNLVNFMDGIDWITCATFVPMLGALALFGLAGWMPPAVAIGAAALCGGLCGFGPANRPVARLFLGDVGSLPIGLATGAMLLALAGSGGLAAALLLGLYYVADATITLGRRLIRRERVWEAHRSHYYQRALDQGWTVLAVDARIATLQLLLAGLAATTLQWPSPPVLVSALAAGATLVGWTLYRFSGPPRSV